VSSSPPSAAPPSAAPSSPSTPGPALVLRYPPELPITARVPDLRAALAAHQVLIVAGATGSGKTTQLPKVALELLGARAGNAGKRPALVGVTQPRRIAATSVAARVATELGCALGAEVGYQIRFEERTSERTCLKFMTDGILLAQIQGDPLLRRYQTLIIDEAHERSLTIDFLLGWLKTILPRRPELKVIISSATIETERFSEFFDNAPVISVEGRTYGVDVLYEPKDPELDLADAVAESVASIAALDPRGDILVFLPGEREIAETERALHDKQLRLTQVLPLFSRLPASEQAKVFGSGSARRVILATNVAETSLTIPGIVYVVDTGVARLSRYDPRTGTTRLQIEPISQASADQRKGRCGRVREGICIRLYDEANFTSRPAFTDPEIRRVGLAGVILRMKAASLGEIETFPFIDGPSGRAITEGYHVLEELGALGPGRELTALGKQLAKFPVDPRIARMILSGAELGCLDEVLVLAAALEVQDPRERPRAAEQKADQLHRRFKDERSDFVGLLRLWNALREEHKKGTSQLKRWCKENFVSFARVREWREVHRQLRDAVTELRLDPRSKSAQQPSAAPEPGTDIVHQALLSGLLSRIGQYNAEQRVYLGARQTRFVLHPSSALAKKPPAWVMAFELVETTQLFARNAGRVDPEWLDRVAGHLLKRSYSEPHWSEKSARATVKEHSTLYGLPVLKDRSVDYSKLNPARARLMFLEHALVRGEYTTRGEFFNANRALLAEVARLRDKARQSDMLADDEALLNFFDERVAASVVNGPTFETWRQVAERTAPRCLWLSLKDVLVGANELSPLDYPDELVLHGARLPLSYVFDPSADNDGVTLSVPLALVPRLDAAELDWTIPAWHERRLLELLQGLPKAQRQQLGPLPELARKLATELVPFSEALLPALLKAVRKHGGVSIPEGAFRPDTLLPYLRLTCRVCSETGKVLGESRDLPQLFERFGAQARQALQTANPAADFQRTGLTTWNFGDLPSNVTRTVLGTQLHLYPAILDRQKAVDLELLDSARAAETANRSGIRRLLAFALTQKLAPLDKRTPKPFTRRVGMPPSRAESDTFRDAVRNRILDEAFFAGGEGLPRTQRAFEQLLQQRTPQLETAATRVFQALNLASSELDDTLRALEKAEKQPSGAGAVRDMRDQLDALFPTGLITDAPLLQLAHYPRYLKAIRLRLTRALVDPRKDAAKLEPLLAPLALFQAKRHTASDQSSSRALGWALEELRVAVFAPELKPAHAVSISTWAAAVKALE
jgi:ATP-dependent helicase HrpA